ncbi:uncharacterized protein LOC110031579 [Phalaenopsis equestris]|uniref:uncharacterized protein LOC110031579 n=1 Tax=Phalaenopsis equestris TaxID=78828 RepID=UPI0009E558E9|nr:uncharacterized protein LOC110031579 [Phalaenopsis equestris]
MLLCFDCHYVCKFACMASMDQQSFFSGVEHSEVDEALFGFHDDSYFLPFDTIFQNDTDSLMFSASPANGDQQSFVCGVEDSEVDEAIFGFHDDSHLLPLDAIFQNDMDSLMISASPANGEGFNNFFLPSHDRIHEQPPPLFEQSSF